MGTKRLSHTIATIIMVVSISLSGSLPAQAVATPTCNQKLAERLECESRILLSGDSENLINNAAKKDIGKFKNTSIDKNKVAALMKKTDLWNNPSVSTWIKSRESYIKRTDSQWCAWMASFLLRSSDVKVPYETFAGILAWKALRAGGTIVPKQSGSQLAVMLPRDIVVYTNKSYNDAVLDLRKSSSAAARSTFDHVGVVVKVGARAAILEGNYGGVIRIKSNPYGWTQHVVVRPAKS